MTDAKKPRGRVTRLGAWMTVAIISMCLHALWGFGFALDLHERNERRGKLNDLACAIRADSSNSGAVASSRGLRGDSAIVASKSNLANAALKVAGSCPAPPVENPTRE